MRKMFGKDKARKSREKVVGEVRQSQLITSFGCGAMVDFIYDTVIIAGTDKWDWLLESPNNEFIIYNENLQNLLAKDYFVKPKTDTTRRPMFAEKTKDIPAYRFPEILYCTKCHRLNHYSAFDHQRAKQMKCICGNKSLVPSRFVAVCENGHMEDFPYSEWVHFGKKCSKGDRPKLTLFNADGKSGIDSLLVKCISCDQVRPMRGAFAENGLVNIKSCEGKMPWLPKSTTCECSSVLKTRLRTSTNVFFPITVGALSIPPWSDKIYKVLEAYYYDLTINPDLTERLITSIVQPKLPGVSFDDIILALNDLKRTRQGERGKKTQQDIYRDEFIALSRNEGTSDDEFSPQNMDVPNKYKSVITKIAAIDKLTEVVAMLGFTRVKPWSGKLDDERIAPLSLRRQRWLPAVKMNGEGIFIQFDTARIERWTKSIGDYYGPMFKRLEKSFLSNERASCQYIFLHTFAHLLIKQLSLECGYYTASLKEKIYSTFSDGDDNFRMAGILIYTATPDSDGSLGGLVEQAYPERLGTIIDRMLDTARWCSSDPLCISSFGNEGQGFESLNYAACHSCALLPETSCEFRNLLLDRGALIGRPDWPHLGLFNLMESEA